jgi:hypothetical protein
MRFIPKEGYELIGSLVKVDPVLAKHLLKLLKGTDLVADDDSPTGYSESAIEGAKPFCNADGVEKITDFIIIHINTPLSYKEGKLALPPSQIAKEIAKQFIKDFAANYQRWDIQNPSLIPEISSIMFQYLKASQGQQGELPEQLLAGGALKQRAQEPEPRKKGIYL